MPVKNILSVYSGEDARVAGLDHAIRIARHHEGWITGCVIHGHSVLEQRFATLLSEHVLSNLREIDENRISAIKSRFEERTALAGVSAEFIECSSDETLSVAARNFDLIVMGRHHAELDEDHLSAHPEYVAVHSGRPILVVPDGYTADSLADHAVVAWDGKRAAARALGDALPFLADKAKVTVLTIGKSKPDLDDPASPLRLLARHRINAVHHHVQRDGNSIGQTIMTAADDVGAKLIVMGAFEHSRLGQSIVGGATTDVLRNAAVPVFLSH